MTVRIVLFLASVLLIISPLTVSLASEWYVDASVAKSGNGRSWEEAFETIQEGIDAASQGDAVIVAEGTYVENIDFHGKNITLRSTNPEDSATVTGTIIDGGGEDSVVRFSGSESQTCVLSGFTVQNGFYSWGGGVFGNGSRATIQNNVIRNNKAMQGGGLAHCEGAVRNNVISGNNAVQEGGGLYRCHGEVEKNTVFGNSAERGGGLYGYEGTIRNCIIWGNVGQIDEQVADTLSPTYCCIQNWERGGEGNMSWFPYLIDPAHGDYHLQSWSPGIDAGDPSSDFSREPQPNGRRINMGAYGNTGQAASASEDVDGDSLPDDWEMYYFGGLDRGAFDDPDGDGLSCLEEYHSGMESVVVWHVDGSVPASGDGTSWRTAFKTIQEGVDAASDRDTVIVAEGTYVENVHFKGKNITLRSTDPLDSRIIGNTIVEGNQAGSVITFEGTENETCILSGFTVRNGADELGGGVYGGAPPNLAQATIQNNVITRNSAKQYGGGLAFCAGTIQNNRITGNVAERGSGGGLFWCDGIIQNNIITGNRAKGEYSSGGGLSRCGGIIQNNTIVGNSTQGSYMGLGDGLYDCDGTIVNCIIWGNGCQGQLSNCSLPTYSCIEGWTGGGDGNIVVYPHFADVQNGDFHLASWSPCIDSGDPSSEFSKEGEPNGGRVNMGAYGNTPEAASKSSDTDSDRLPDDWELHWFGDMRHNDAADPDGDRVLNITEYRYAWNPTAAAEKSAENLTTGLAYETIQTALWESQNGDEIMVHPGLYEENINLGGRNIVLRSIDPSDPDVVARTIIDGSECASVVTLSGWEDETCVLSGFTIQNGTGEAGGGICGGTRAKHNRATIRNNVVKNNKGKLWSHGGGLAFCDGLIENNTILCNSTGGGNGGGLFACNGTIQNNRISENAANEDCFWDCSGGEGGGLYGCRGTIRENRITLNSAEVSGGALSDCDGEIENNVIARNFSSWGGGLANCDGLVQGNVVATNRAEDGAGGGVFGCSGVIRNNIICSNSVTGWFGTGGGASACSGVIQNNTIHGNSAEWGGGLANCSGIISNCIIWGNTAFDGRQLHDSAVPIYSCLQVPSGGEGNISSDPRFADSDGPDDDPATCEDNDYRLLPDSQCIDAGENALWMRRGVDLDGNPRIWGGMADMGAYEYGSWLFSIGQVVKTAGHGAEISWKSRPGDTYIVQSCCDLLSGVWEVEATLPSQGESTAWTDSDTMSPQKFYRIELK